MTSQQRFLIRLRARLCMAWRELVYGPPDYVEFMIASVTLGWAMLLVFDPVFLTSRTGYRYLAWAPGLVTGLALTGLALGQMTAVLIGPPRLRLFLMAVQWPLWAGIMLALTWSTGISTGTTTYSTVCVLGGAWAISRLIWEARKP